MLPCSIREFASGSLELIKRTGELEVPSIIILLVELEMLNSLGLIVIYNGFPVCFIVMFFVTSVSTSGISPVITSSTCLSSLPVCSLTEKLIASDNVVPLLPPEFIL